MTDTGLCAATITAGETVELAEQSRNSLNKEVIRFIPIKNSGKYTKIDYVKIRQNILVISINDA